MAFVDPIHAQTSTEFNNQGLAKYNTKDYNGALLDFNKAIELYPNYLEAYGNRSIAKYQVKDLTGALQDCDKVLQLSPGNANAIDLKT